MTGVQTCALPICLLTSAQISLLTTVPAMAQRHDGGAAAVAQDQATLAAAGISGDALTRHLEEGD